MLIDAGLKVKGDDFSGYTELKSEIRDLGVEEIDHLVVSHAHQDHYKYVKSTYSWGSIPEDFDVENAYYPSVEDELAETPDYIDDSWIPADAGNGNLEGGRYSGSPSTWRCTTHRRAPGRAVRKCATAIRSR